ncbi:thiosulfate:glutathione sulfurtransferase-like [Ornithodoros turicata]
MFAKAAVTIPRVVYRFARAPALSTSKRNISILGVTWHRKLSTHDARSHYTVIRDGNITAGYCGCRHISTTDISFKDISLEDLEALIQGGDIQLIDVREPSEVKGTGMISKAVNIPLGQVKEALLLPDESFQDRYKAPKPQAHDHNVVFYGLGPIKSEAALQLAKKAGYLYARQYSGGWEEYSKKSKA